jgi:hypothetical protein
MISTTGKLFVFSTVLEEKIPFQSIKKYKVTGKRSVPLVILKIHILLSISVANTCSSNVQIEFIKT